MQVESQNKVILEWLDTNIMEILEKQQVGLKYRGKKTKMDSTD